MTFLEQITQAYKERKEFDEDQAQSSKRRIEARVKEGLTKLGVTEPFIPDGLQVQFDRIIIRAVLHNDRNLDWQVQGVCPDCSKTCWSRKVAILEHIGEMHYDFKPYNHHCALPKKTLTVSENLIDALRQFIEEEVGNPRFEALVGGFSPTTAPHNPRPRASLQEV